MHKTIILSVLIVGCGCSGKQKSADVPAPTVAPNEMESILRDRAQKQMEAQNIRAQIGVYEQLSKAAPESKETQRRLTELRQRLAELEK